MSATAIGVDRDPGQMTAWDTPHRTHSSTRVAANSICVSPSPGAGSGVDTLMEEDNSCHVARSPTHEPNSDIPHGGRFAVRRSDGQWAPDCHGAWIHPDLPGVGLDGFHVGNRSRAHAGRYAGPREVGPCEDRKSTRLNSSHLGISSA